MIPQKYIKLFIEELREAISDNPELKGHVYLVGGCVRDTLLDMPVKDIDVVLDVRNGASLLAEHLHRKGMLVYEPVKFPVYGVASFEFRLSDGASITVEAVHTRKEIYNHENRNPVTAYGTLEEDALRRDLTINAFYQSVETGEIISPLGQRAFDNLNNCILDTCDEPITTFNDDPLRVLRAIRFACKPGLVDKGFKLSERVSKAILDHEYNMSMLAWERIMSELRQICVSDNLHTVLDLLRAVVNPEKEKIFDNFLGQFFSKADIDFPPYIPKGCEDNFGYVAAWMSSFMPHYERPDYKEFNNIRLTVEEAKTAINIMKVFHCMEQCDGEDCTKALKFLAYQLKDKEVIEAGIQLDTWYLCYPVKTSESYIDSIKDFCDFDLFLNGNDIMRITGCKPGKIVKELLDDCVLAVISDPSLNTEKQEELVKLVLSNYNLKKS